MKDERILEHRFYNSGSPAKKFDFQATTRAREDGVDIPGWLGQTEAQV